MTAFKFGTAFQAGVDKLRPGWRVTECDLMSSLSLETQAIARVT